MDKLLTIGKLSKMTGISARSIRHYERVGLLERSANSNSNYRLYGEKEVRRLQKILLLRSLGFSLSEVLEILTANENFKIAEIFDNRLNILKKEVSKLNRSKEMLETVTSVYKTHGLEYINDFHLIKEMISMSTKFSRIFNQLELELQIKILKELYTTATLLPDTLREIGSDSGQILLNEIRMAMVTSLLNKSEPETEKNIMMKLEKEDLEFSNEIKNALFTFDDIARLPDEIIKKWLDKCKDSELRLALKNSSKYLKNKILLNMSSERAYKINENAENEISAGVEKEFSAMSNLVDVLRQMELNGEIVIERF